MTGLRTIASLTLVALAMSDAGAVLADDGWNPFKEREEAQSASRSSRSKAGDTQPAAQSDPLPPMDGVGSRPWISDRPTAPSAWNPSGTSANGPPPSDQPVWRDDPAVARRPATVDVAPSQAVERSDLSSPVMTSDGSGLPHDFWQGLDLARTQEMMAALAIPPRSRSLNDLWRRLWTSTALEAPRQGSGRSSGDASYRAVRIEALYRSGLIAELSRTLKDLPVEASDTVVGVLTARSRIGLGEGPEGCASVKAQQRNLASMPKPVRAELMVLGAWCGASGKDGAAAGLAADLLRAENIDAPLALAALDALSAGSADAFRAAKPKTASLLDYRFLELVQPDAAASLIPMAEPALLATLAASGSAPKSRILAGEAALRANVITPPELAAIYRLATPAQTTGADSGAERDEPALRRAALFKGIETERTPQRKTRLIRSLLDDTKRSGHYMQTAAMLSAAIADIVPAPEIGWFAETAIEINLAAGRYDEARRWVEPPAPVERYGGLRHWLVLIDLADAKWRGPRGTNLAEAEHFAVRGRLAPELMHRLVTVLDALDYQIPIPLWESASRTPQPNSGHLPETGVLSELQDAAKKKEHGRTVLLAMRTLGPDSGDTAHMIALGDTIRALRRAGLEPDARRLALEALYSAWPRQASN